MANVRWREIVRDGQIVIEEIHKVVVHRFSVGDIEDPDLYAAQPLYEWEQSEQGQFIMNNAVNKPQWQRQIDHQMFGFRYVIIAELESKKLSEYLLRFK